MTTLSKLPPRLEAATLAAAFPNQIEAERVTWSDFCQPHRSEHKPPVWRYEGLGPFVFNHRQYEAELGKMLADDVYQDAQRRWKAWLEELHSEQI